MNPPGEAPNIIKDINPESYVSSGWIDQAGLWKEGFLGLPLAAPQTGATGGVNK
jgi:hypothetical protein